MRGIALFLLMAGALSGAAQQPRLASDFEIAQMEKQLASSRGFEAQLSGHLNLGDVRSARNELSLARGEYTKAAELAEGERLDARRAADLSRYATATSYAALAHAKLGRDAQAFALLEEAARYASDDAEGWNVYASTMRTLRMPRKAVSAARNAVAIASRGDDKLDLAVYQHALATALIDAGEPAEAERLLVTVTQTLRSPAFASLRRDVARQESFEVYTSARGDVAAYVSLLSRAELRLASLYESRGELDRARAAYRRALEVRSDDVTALSALARLASTDAEREKLYAGAFEANPFSPTLVREYQQYLRTHPASENDATSTGAQMRRALRQLEAGDLRAARTSLDALLAKFPANDTLRSLRRAAEAPAAVSLPSPAPAASELRALVDAFQRLTPEQRQALDRTTYTSVVRFDGGVFESGTVEGVPFRFSEVTHFDGDFNATAPLRLTYRILGVTRNGDTDALLLEPVRLEAIP